MKEKSLKKRIKDGQIRRQDVARRLAELAFGKPNDCVRLVLGDPDGLEGMDLSLLSELRRSEKGAVEVRLVDRLKVLQQLAELVGKESEGMDQLLRSLQGGEGE